MYKGGLFDALQPVFLLKSSMYGEKLLAAYQALRKELLYKSRVHGIDHVCRVMLFGSLIAQAAKLPERDTEILLLTCAYHDIGRVNDRFGPEHGPHGAELVEAHKEEKPFSELSETELRMVKAAIHAHNHSLKHFPEVAALLTIPEECMEKAWFLARALKDADALDIVRQFKIKPQRLKLDISRPLAPVSEAVWKISQAYTK